MKVCRCPKCNHKLVDVTRPKQGVVSLRIRCRYCKEFISFVVDSGCRK